MSEELAESHAGHSVAAPDASKQVKASDNSTDLPVSGLPAGTLDGGRTEAQGRLADRANTTVVPNPVAGLSSIAPAERTELERRVLAHERILQALIAHMAEAEPKFLIRLSETFCVPMEMSRSEHDYTDTDSYAAEFIRSVTRLGEKAARKELAAGRERRVYKIDAAAAASEGAPLAESPRIQMKHAGGIWRVTLDGRFYGDFHTEQDAASAVAADPSVSAQSS